MFETPTRRDLLNDYLDGEIDDEEYRAALDCLEDAEEECAYDAFMESKYGI